MINLGVTIIPALTVKDTKIVTSADGLAPFQSDTAQIWGLDDFDDVLKRWCQTLGQSPGAPNRYYMQPSAAGGNWQGGKGKVVDANGNIESDKATVPSALVDVKVLSAGITKIVEEPVIVDRQVLDARKAPAPVGFHPEISDSVTKGIATSWEESSEIGVSATVGVKTGSDLVGGEVEASTTVSASHSWGKGGSEEKSVAVGNNLALEVELQPGMLAVAALTLNRGVMEVEVQYQAMVSGYAQVQWWGGKFQSANKQAMDFVYVPLGPVLEKLKAGSSVRKATQRIVVDYFADGVAAVYKLDDLKPDSIESAVLGAAGSGPRTVYARDKNDGGYVPDIEGARSKVKTALDGL